MNEGLIIKRARLSGTFERKDFPIISKLIPLCEKIELFRDICPETEIKQHFLIELVIIMKKLIYVVVINIKQLIE